MTPATLVLGLTTGLALSVIWSRWPRLRQPSLLERTAPYLGVRAQPSRLLERSTVARPSGGRNVLQPWLRGRAKTLDRALGGQGSEATTRLQVRLDSLARPLSVESFRVEQLTWGMGGAAVAFAVGLVLGHGRAASAVPSLMLVAIGFVLGVLARDRALTMETNKRRERMAAEFPTVVELLALAVSAGEGVAAAVERVAERGRGELAHEFRRCLADVRAGAPLLDALRAADGRVGLAELHRFVESLTVALERGTPLADVMRAQAADAREASRRALIESGGRKEISMMVPVVFLVLPVSVVFALFPGFYGLSLTSP
jgi:tight adherence protein C